MEFIADYHEDEEFGGAMFGLSQFIIQWNLAEHYFNVLLWALSGDFFTGAQYTTGLGNQSRADLLLVTARRKEKDKEILDLIEFCVKAFGRIKDNRNALAHAHSVTKAEDEGKPRWVRASKNPKSLHVYCYADAEDVARNHLAACNLAMLLSQIMVFYLSTFEEKPRPSIGKFPLPDALTPISIPMEKQEGELR